VHLWLHLSTFDSTVPSRLRRRPLRMLSYQLLITGSASSQYAKRSISVVLGAASRCLAYEHYWNSKSWQWEHL